MKYLTNIDLSQNQLLNAVIQKLAIAPSNPVAGQIYYNTALNTLRFYNGSVWKNASEMTGTDIVVAINGTSSVINIANLPTSVATAVTNSHTHTNKTVLDNTTASFTTTYEALVSGATNSNTASTIVKRDSSGNFSAGTITANLSGNSTTATSASKLTTARTITASGDATGSVSFDGSANATLSLTLANSGVTAGTYKSVTVDGKGRVTAGSNPTTLNEYGITDGLKKTGDTMTGYLTLIANPTQDLHAVTKQYVDAVAQGLDAKASVVSATQSNLSIASFTPTQLTLSTGITSCDMVPLNVGDRILVKDQTTPSQNGIYRYTSSTILDRTDDANTNTKMTSGMYVYVENGATNYCSGWVLSTTGPITLGTTGLNFVQFSGAGQITAGTGITKNGNTLSLSVATTSSLGGVKSGTDITVDANGNVSINDDSHNHTISNIDGLQTLLAGKSNKVTTTIGDGSATSFVITHNLNTQDLIVSIRETTTPYSIVYTDIEMTSANTLTLKFAVAPSSNQYSVVILG